MSEALDEVLPDLPQPQVIEELDYEVILARRMSGVIRAGDELGLNLGDYIEQEFDISRILLEDASYAELLVRSRINQVYRAGLLWFASGADLDHVADRHGVSRLAGEPDEDLRERVRIKVRGSSAAGAQDWWRQHAMRADERVEDVAVTLIPVGPDNQLRGLIELAVLAQTADGIPSDEILENVRAVVTSRAVRTLGSSPRVVAATTRPFDVRARIWLRAGAAISIADGLEARLRKAFARARGLGFDIAPSWIIAQLQVPNVQRVELVDFDAPLVVPDTKAPRLETVEIKFMGHDG